MKWILACGLVLFYSVSSAQIFGKVVGVKDGDTVVLLLEGNVQKTIRLADVDCPESGQSFGKNAKKFTSDKVFGKKVKLIEAGKDRWGRTIGEIYYGKFYLSAEIIKAGYGWWYQQYSKKNELKALQVKAKNQKIGLWQEKNPVSPWEYRKLKREKSKKSKV